MVARARKAAPAAAAPAEAPFSLSGWPLYLVGRWMGVTSSGVSLWEYLGLAIDESEADRFCTQRDDFFVRVAVGERVPDASSVWPHVTYPRRA